MSACEGVTMKHRSLRIVAALATLGAVLSCGGADGLAPTTSTEPGTIDSKLRAGLHASGTMAAGNVALDRVAANSSAAPSEEVSWVSLVPGTVADGTTATIINLRSTRRTASTIVDGCFDTYPILSSSGVSIQ